MKILIYPIFLFFISYSNYTFSAAPSIAAAISACESSNSVVNNGYTCVISPDLSYCDSYPNGNVFVAESCLFIEGTYQYCDDYFTAVCANLVTCPDGSRADSQEECPLPPPDCPDGQVKTIFPDDIEMTCHTYKDVCEIEQEGYWDTGSESCFPTQEIYECAVSGGTAITTDSNTSCDCPTGSSNVNGVCASTSDCGENETAVYDQSGNLSFCIQDPNSCPDGSPLVNGECAPPKCDLGQHYDSYTDSCISDNLKEPECPDGYNIEGDICLKDPISCPDGSEADANGACLAPPECPNGQAKVNGLCEQPPQCPDGQTQDYEGNCHTPVKNYPEGSTKDKFNNCIIDNPLCSDGTAPTASGQCINNEVCADGSSPDSSGKCDSQCPDGTTLKNGICLRDFECPANATKVNGQCVVNRICEDGSDSVNGQCTTFQKCPDGSPPNSNGKCIVPDVCPNGDGPDSNGKCIVSNQCPNGDAPDSNGKCAIETQCPSGSEKNASGQCEGAGEGEEGNASPGSRDCTKEPTCQGDPIQCAQLKQEWTLHCETVSKDDDTAGLKVKENKLEYEKTDLKYTDVFTNFTNGIKNSAIISEASRFFVISISGTCPIYSSSIPYINFTMTFDHLCVPPMSNHWPLIRAILLATASFLAFRWAFL